MSTSKIAWSIVLSLAFSAHALAAVSGTSTTPAAPSGNSVGTPDSYNGTVNQPGINNTNTEENPNVVTTHNNSTNSNTSVADPTPTHDNKLPTNSGMNH